jgi:hypothetical protein
MYYLLIQIIQKFRRLETHLWLCESQQSNLLVLGILGL